MKSADTSTSGVGARLMRGEAAGCMSDLASCFPNALGSLRVAYAVVLVGLFLIGHAAHRV